MRREIGLLDFEGARCRDVLDGFQEPYTQMVYLVQYDAVRHVFNSNPEQHLMKNLECVSISILQGRKEFNSCDSLLAAVIQETMLDEIVPRPGIDDDGHRHL